MKNRSKFKLDFVFDEASIPADKNQGTHFFLHPSIHYVDPGPFLPHFELSTHKLARLSASKRRGQERERKERQGRKKEIPVLPRFTLEREKNP